jgi:polyisoprenoid-binding protein YceI
VSTTSAPPARRRRLALIAVAVIGLIALAAVAVFLLGGDAPAEVAIDDAVAELDDPAAEEATSEDATSEDATSGDAEEAAPEAEGADTGGASADGTWTVDTEVEPFDLAASTGSFLGYRIDEELANVGATQAVGRTPAVTGGLTVDGTSVTDAVVEGELAELRSDRPQRDGRVATALEAEAHPTVRFTAERFELPAELADGDRVEVEVPGTIEAAGGSTEVVALVVAQRVGDVVVATGSLDLPLADVGVTAPSAAIVLGVADTATIEWQLYLTRS